MGLTARVNFLRVEHSSSSDMKIILYVNIFWKFSDKYQINGLGTKLFPKCEK